MKFLDRFVGKSWHGKAMIVFMLWLFLDGRSTYIPSCDPKPRTEACTKALVEKWQRQFRPFPFNLYPFVRFPFY